MITAGDDVWDRLVIVHVPALPFPPAPARTCSLTVLSLLLLLQAKGSKFRARPFESNYELGEICGDGMAGSPSPSSTTTRTERLSMSTSNLLRRRQARRAQNAPRDG